MILQTSHLATENDILVTPSVLFPARRRMPTTASMSTSVRTKPGRMFSMPNLGRQNLDCLPRFNYRFLKNRKIVRMGIFEMRKLKKLRKSTRLETMARVYHPRYHSTRWVTPVPREISFLSPEWISTHFVTVLHNFWEPLHSRTASPTALPRLALDLHLLLR